MPRLIERATEWRDIAAGYHRFEVKFTCAVCGRKAIETIRGTREDALALEQGSPVCEHCADEYAGPMPIDDKPVDIDFALDLMAEQYAAAADASRADEWDRYVMSKHKHRFDDSGYCVTCGVDIDPTSD